LVDVVLITISSSHLLIMAFQWRRFQFFDRETLTNNATNNSAVIFSDNYIPVSSCSGRGYIILGDARGLIRLVDREFNKKTWLGHEGSIIQLIILKKQSILLSLGYEAENSNVSIKLWLLDKLDAENNPVLARNIKVFSKQFPQVPISCVSCLEDLSQLAIGLGNGAIMLFEGNLIRDRSPKQSLIQREGKIVTGLHYRETPELTSLFVVTTDTVSTFYTKSGKINRVEIDAEGGADLKCSTMNDKARLVIANDEAVYFYEPEEKRQAFGFKGNKKQVAWFGNYLVLVQEMGREAGEDSGAGSKDSGEIVISRNQLTIYDLANKFIAYQAKFDPINDIIAEWGCLYILCNTDNAAESQNSADLAPISMYCLSEKDLSSKMDMLFKKNLYQIALSLAASSGSDSSYLEEIYTMYGDHLYSKGDYDGAIQQYIQTIHSVEPSYVIRKFLDAQRINNLTNYLQELHTVGRANSDHTTLLLNCYTKLKDHNKLENFIKSIDSGANSGKFDVITAISVCRSAGYHDYALYLAEKSQQTELFIKITIEDNKNYALALETIGKMQFPAAESAAKLYGDKLIAAEPERTTQLFIDMCSNWPAALNPGKLRSKPEDFLAFFIDFPKNCEKFIENIIETGQNNKIQPVLYNTLLELYLKGNEQLETNGNEANSPDSGPKKQHANYSKLMNLLKSTSARYDVDQALLLCKKHEFEKGILYLYSKLRLFREIIVHHAQQKQYAKLIRACKKHAATEPELWTQALQIFAEAQQPCEEEIQITLENIERFNLLPPLRVIQILSGQNSAENNNGVRDDHFQQNHKPLSVVKDYMIRQLKAEMNIINADQHEIQRYQSDTAIMKNEINKLQTQPTTFQGIKCHACSNGLNLPAVHFLCMHSYHVRCIQESLLNDSLGQETINNLNKSSDSLSSLSCPRCSPEYRKVKEIKDSMRQSSSAHDRFYKQLEDSSDGFGTVAEYFGRGIFEKDNKNINTNNNTS
jgi:hypothetical protein